MGTLRPYQTRSLLIQKFLLSKILMQKVTPQSQLHAIFLPLFIMTGQLELLWWTPLTLSIFLRVLHLHLSPLGHE